MIAGSALVTLRAPGHVRVALQGATDAGMNYAGAGAAALAGPLLAVGGFEAVNVTAALLLFPAIVLLPKAMRSSREPLLSPR